MVKPFQFSMRRMFAAVTAWCISAGLLSWLIRSGGNGFGPDMVGLISVGAIGGGGLGIIIRRPFMGAAAGGSLAVILAFTYFYWFVSTHSAR